MTNSIYVEMEWCVSGLHHVNGTWKERMPNANYIRGVASNIFVQKIGFYDEQKRYI